MSPRFSVIITTYDRQALLNEAITSVLEQTVRDLECIVVDDASPQPAVVPDEPRVRLIRHRENGGLAVSRNTGLEAARGDAIAFLDDDDRFTPERLAIAVRTLGRAPVAICGIRYLADPPSTASWTRCLEGDVRDELFEDMTPHLGQTVVGREDILRFDPAFVAAQDVEWWVRMCQHTGVSTDLEVGYLFRRHQGVRHGNGLPARVRFREQVLRTHTDFFAARPRSAAFQWKRIGLTALSAGEPMAARRAFRQSLRLHPAPRTAWHLARSLAVRQASARS